VFGRYTENARRAVFFARYECGIRALKEITPLHLLLGIMREGGPGIEIALDLQNKRDAIFGQIRLPEPVPKEKRDINTDIPLSKDSKMALAWTVREADRDDSEQVDPTHLLRGLLCFPNDAQIALHTVGIGLDPLRDLAKEGRLRVPFWRRLMFQFRRLFREAIWPAFAQLALVFGIGVLIAIALSLLGH
jgi:ATP-dependent Clp protease ATP-binding subunit ClpC